MNIHPQRNVRGLFLDGRDDRAGLIVKAVLGPSISSVADGVSHNLRDVDVTFGRNLSRDEGHAGRYEGFTGHPAVRVLTEDRVKNRIRNLIRDLVGMAFGDRLGRKQIAS